MLSPQPWLDRPVQGAIGEILKAGRIVFLSAPKLFGKMSTLGHLDVRANPLSLYDLQSLRSKLSLLSHNEEATSIYEAIHQVAKVSSASNPTILHITDGQSLSPLVGDGKCSARVDALGQVLSAFEYPDIRSCVRLVITSLVPFSRVGEGYWATRLPEQSITEFSLEESKKLATSYGLTPSNKEVEELRLQVGGHPYLTSLVLKSAQESKNKLGEVLPLTSHDNGPLAPFFRAVWE
mgnify:CR=1 FL=1